MVMMGIAVTVVRACRSPHGWWQCSGSNHALCWVDMSRQSELQHGDTLFSPFMAAGWHGKAELNTRPPQWLGLLKVVAAWYERLTHYTAVRYRTTCSLARLSKFTCALLLLVEHCVEQSTGGQNGSMQVQRSGKNSCHQRNASLIH